MTLDELERKSDTVGLTVEEITEYQRLIKPIRHAYGKYGTLARRYLEEHNIGKYWALAGNLPEYLHGVDKAAERLYEVMWDKLSKDERYKRTGKYLEDVHRIGEMQKLIEEEIFNEIVYVV